MEVDHLQIVHLTANSSTTRAIGSKVAMLCIFVPDVTVAKPCRAAECQTFDPLPAAVVNPSLCLSGDTWFAQ